MKKLIKLDNSRSQATIKLNLNFQKLLNLKAVNVAYKVMPVYYIRQNGQ
jgi:hypothetical protein